MGLRGEDRGRRSRFLGLVLVEGLLLLHQQGERGPFQFPVQHGLDALQGVVGRAVARPRAGRRIDQALVQGAGRVGDVQDLLKRDGLGLPGQLDPAPDATLGLDQPRLGQCLG